MEAEPTKSRAGSQGRGGGRLSDVLTRLKTRLASIGPGSATPSGILQLHLLVALVAPALMFATILFMADRQNADARATERQRATGLLTYLHDQFALEGSDSANWNEGYGAIVRIFDRDWLDGTLGPDAFGTSGYHDVFILDADGRAIYASVLGIVGNEQPADSLGPHLRHQLAAASRSTGPNGVAEYVRYGDGVALSSLTRIRPVDPVLARRGDPVRYLLLIKRFDAQTLREIGQASGFGDFRIMPPGSPDRASVPIRSGERTEVARLAWTSAAPGYASAIDVLPVALILLALLAYAGFVGASTARRRAEELLESRREALALARRDALTGLPNRRGFAATLEDALADGQGTALIYLDLDGFKDVNDAFGHAVGDALLCAAAERLASVSAIEPARFGGDEFGLLVEAGPDLLLRAGRLADRIVAAFGASFDAAGRKVYVGTSIGIAVASPGMTADELVRRADVAMYAAKSAGRGRWRVYDSASEDGRERRREIAAELRAALASGTVSVLFQPIIDADDGAIVAAEALARWNSRSFGVIDPDLFIAVAEESGQISELTRQILRQACAAGAAWRIAVSVNLSAAEVWDIAFAEELIAILSETGMVASRLILEITESHLIREAGLTAQTLMRLRALGVRIALDDFGTGYSSLRQLGTLPLDGLKLTREFLERAGGPAAQDVAEAIVGLATALRLPVTAEGIETAEQAAAMRQAGCAYLQGWHYGRPVPASELTRRLAQQPVAVSG